LIMKQKNSNIESSFLSGTSVLPKNWSRAIDALKKEKLRSMVSRTDLMAEMDKIRSHMLALKSSNEALTKSNEDLRTLLLLSLKEERELSLKEE